MGERGGAALVTRMDAREEVLATSLKATHSRQAAEE